MDKATVVSEMLESYDLEIDVDAIFGKSGDGLSKADFEAVIVKH